MVAPAKKRHAILELARRAEELKFAGIACPSLGATMGLCVSLAHSTNEIKFWTSIQPIYYSHAIEMANTAAHIHEVSNGRFALGLGVSHGPVIDRLGATTATPLADIKNYLATMKAQERFSGDLPPIYLAALRNKMMHLASEISKPRASSCRCPKSLLLSMPDHAHCARRTQTRSWRHSTCVT